MVPNINIDYVAVKEAKRKLLKESLIRLKEIQYYGDKLVWCVRREGVNHQENCRELALEYAQLLKTAKLAKFPKK